MSVEEGTKALILANFSVRRELTFNNLRTNFGGGNALEEFFNS
jgi:hypothetical protein